jgi:hypothetical protein
MLKLSQHFPQRYLRIISVFSWTVSWNHLSIFLEGTLELPLSISFWNYYEILVIFMETIFCIRLLDFLNATVNRPRGSAYNVTVHTEVTTNNCIICLSYKPHIWVKRSTDVSWVFWEVLQVLPHLSQKVCLINKGGMQFASIFYSELNTKDMMVKGSIFMS